MRQNSYLPPLELKKKPQLFNARAWQRGRIPAHILKMPPETLVLRKKGLCPAALPPPPFPRKPRGIPPLLPGPFLSAARKREEDEDAACASVQGKGVELSGLPPRLPRLEAVQPAWPGLACWVGRRRQATPPRREAPWWKLGLWTSRGKTSGGRTAWSPTRPSAWSSCGSSASATGK